MGLRDQLHSEIDEIEKTTTTAADVVERVLEDNLNIVLEASQGDMTAALAILASLVEERLMVITTSEFKAGAERARRRIDAS